MTPYKKTRDLARWTIGVLTEPVALPPTVEDYMYGTFGSSDLESILKDEDSSEIDSLLELLFYPDLAVKDRFESRWGDHRFTAQDRDAIVDSICETPIRASVMVPGHGGTVAIVLPAFVIEAFVRRLNITWQPGAELQSCLERHSAHRHITRIRSHLRHARLAWHTGQVNLIDRCLTGMSQEADGFESNLLFLLEILPELPESSDAFDFLVAKKYFYFQALCKAEDFERKRRSSNMEIMMLQGNRAAYGSIAQWRRHMRQIDHVCRTLFGRTRFFQQPNALSVDRGHAGTEPRIDKIIQQLS